MAENTVRLAVLIDADNASINAIGDILAEVSKFGTASVKRAYGDFTSSNLQNWGKILAEHAIQPVQQYRNTIGKNASDAALIIDAMDLLHTRHLEGFCLVSSDSDFTRLATRIKEDGLPVYGFGEQKTPNSFVKACSRFLYTEIFKASPPAPAAVKLSIDGKSPRVARSKSKTVNRPVLPEAMPLLKLATDTDFQAALDQAIDAATPADESRVHLAAVGIHLQKLLPEFDSRNYGFKKLSDLLLTISTVKLTWEGEPPRVYIERQ